jgi:hypothetical protein
MGLAGPMRVLAGHPAPTVFGELLLPDRDAFLDLFNNVPRAGVGIRAVAGAYDNDENVLANGKPPDAVDDVNMQEVVEVCCIMCNLLKLRTGYILVGFKLHLGNVVVPDNAIEDDNGPGSRPLCVLDQPANIDIIPLNCNHAAGHPDYPPATGGNTAISSPSIIRTVAASSCSIRFPFRITMTNSWKFP